MSIAKEKRANSLDLYLKLLEKYNNSQANPSAEEITAILDVMTKELLIAGYSPLLDCACHVLQKRTQYVPQYFRVRKPTLKKVVSNSDAQVWLYLLAGSLKGNADDLASRIEECHTSLCKKVKLAAQDPKAVDRILVQIDKRLLCSRAALFRAHDGNVPVKVASETVEEHSAEPSPATSESSYLEQKDHLSLHNEVLAFFTQQFDLLRPALMEVNDRMRTMEDSIQQKNTEKAYRQWIELYELIADVRDSTRQKAMETGSVDLENAAYNLEEFLYMISDALAEYGIDTIATAPDSPFNGKYHDVGMERNFDPRTAIVAESLRSGFVWGERVLKKERIRLQK